MVKASDKKSGERPADPADFSHLADALKDMPHVPLHPLMAHPAAAVAAATAIGFGIATQMTSAFLGSMQAALEASNALARRQDGDRDDTSAPESDAGPKAEKPVARTAKPKVAKSGSAKSAPAQSAFAKAAPAKAAPVKEKAPAAGHKVAGKSAATARRSGKKDDLKKISGIGPKIEQVLAGMGVTRYADIAGWSAADIARIDGELGLSGRIGRDDWVGQAKALEGGKA